MCGQEVVPLFFFFIKIHLNKISLILILSSGWLFLLKTFFFPFISLYIYRNNNYNNDYYKNVFATLVTPLYRPVRRLAINTPFLTVNNMSAAAAAGISEVWSFLPSCGCPLAQNGTKMWFKLPQYHLYPQGHHVHHLQTSIMEGVHIRYL